MTQRAPSHPLPSQFFMFLLLAGLGFAGNALHFPIFHGVDFLFGSVATLVAVYLIGSFWGALAALVAASYTYALWGHPYAAVVLVGEALFVGTFLRRRGDLLLSVGLYWATVGPALVLLIYHYVLGVDAPGTALVMLKQAVNGIFNGLLASLIVTYTPVRAWTGRTEDRTPPLRRVLFNLFVALVLFPAVLFIFFDGRREMGRVEGEIRTQLHASSRDIRNHLRFWLHAHQLAVARLADRARQERLSPESLGEDLQLLQGAYPDFNSLRLADDRGRVIAAHPERNLRGERIVGQELSGRSYFRTMRETGGAALSNVYRGSDGMPTVTVSSPVLLEGRFAGGVLGPMNLGYLGGMLRGYSDTSRLWVSLVDARGRVIATTQPGLEPFHGFRIRPGGKVGWRDSDSFEWRPESGKTSMGRWREALYGRKVSVEGSPWSLVVLAPIEPYQAHLRSRFTQRLAILLGLSLLSMALANLLASRLARPLARLSEATADLPDRLREEGTSSGVTWPESSVRETAALIESFRGMAGTLQGQFREARSANETLEEQAGELARINEELNAEIRERSRIEGELVQRARLAACGEEVSAIVARGEDLSSILQGSAEALARHLDVPFARIWVTDAAEDALVLRASAGLHTRLDGAHRRIAVGEKKIGMVAKERRPYLTNDIFRDMEFLDREWARGHGLEAFAAYPLLVENRAVGVLAMFSRQPFPEETAHEIASIADGVAQCIERKRAEAERRAVERRFRALIEESSDAIALVDEHGTVLYASPSTHRILGFTPEEAVGMNVFDHMNLEDRERIRPDIEYLLAEPRRQITVHYRYEHRDGSVRWLEAIATNLRDEPSVGAVVSNYRDVTDRRNLEIRLQQRAEELAEANRRKDEFLAMLAHELRNPLGPVMNALYLLRQGGEGEAQERAREVIDRQVRHMARLMDDLLDVSRITRGKAEIRREPLDLSELARNGARDHRSIMEAAGLSFDVELPEAPVWVEGDVTRLSQVIGNLMLNASKFTEPGGRVTVRLGRTPDGGHAALSVRDTGIGIAPDLLPHVFDTFTQADRSLDRSRGGLGLGLSLVKGLVEMHGGEVSVHSAGLGRGAEFTVTLPLANPPAEAAAPAEKAEKEAPAAPPLQILIIEDHRIAAESLSELLRRMGHVVEVAHTGPEGLERARERAPDVTLCDLGLPGMDGYSVGAVLRKAYAEMRLVAITGYGREEDFRRTRSLGFDRHLVKPVDPEELRRVLQEVGGRRNGR